MSAPAPAAGGRRAGYALVLVLALAAQAMVAVATFFAGLGWGGATWLVALAQAGAGVALVVRLGNRRSWWVLAVPVASALLSVGLALLAEEYAAATECSDREKEAFAQLAPVPGVTLDLEGDINNGCSAYANTDTPGPEVAAHYTETLRENGWTIRTDQRDYVEAERDDVRIFVYTPTGEDGLVIVEISDFAER